MRASRQISPTTGFRKMPIRSISTSTTLPGLRNTGGLRKTDAGRRAREHQIAGGERADVRGVRDEFLHREDELRGMGVLHHLAVEPQLDLEVPRLRDFIGGDQRRPDGGKGIEGLAQEPLTARFTKLPITSRHVVTADVAGNMIESPLDRDMTAAKPDHDDQFGLVIDLVAQTRNHDRIPIRAGAVANFEKNTGSAGGATPLSFAWSA